MNIKTAIATLKKARAFAAENDHLNAARFGLAAQQQARQCRSRMKEDVEFHGHSMAVGRSGHLLRFEEGVSHQDRCEAGRIRAESQYLYNGHKR